MLSVLARIALTNSKDLLAAIKAVHDSGEGKLKGWEEVVEVAELTVWLGAGCGYEREEIELEKSSIEKKQQISKPTN